MRVKVASLLLGSVLVFSSPMAYAQEKISLGVAWIGKSNSTTTLFNAMKKHLGEIAPTIDLEVLADLPNPDDFDKAVKRFGTEKAGMVLLRDTSADYLKANPAKLPTFIGGMNSPEDLKIVDSNKHPGGNITGVSYYLSMQTVLRSFMEIIPSAKHFVLIIDGKHPGGQIDKLEMEKACKDFSLTCETVAVNSGDEAEAYLKSSAGKADAIILGNQGKLIDDSAAIVAAAGTTPVFGLAGASARAGALAGFVADIDKLGRQLADSIVQALVKKTPIGDIPIQLDTDPVLIVNMTTATRLKLDVPLAVLQAATTVE